MRVGKGLLAAALAGGLLALGGCVAAPPPHAGCNVQGSERKGALSCLLVKYWPLPERLGDYPEMQDAALRARPSFAVAFQGGGNRAAPAALGQLNALHAMGWIDRVRYISAISGGSWMAIPYTYLPRDRSQVAFLGTYHAPDSLVMAMGRVARDGSAEEFAPGTMLGAVSRSAISLKVVGAWLSGRFDESFAEALSKIYLAPFGLGRDPVTGNERYFSWRRADRDDFLRRNPGLRAGEVLYVERKRPYLIVGGTLMTVRARSGPDEKFRMEMTPLYSGSHVRLTRRFGNGETVKLVDGLVESAGFDRVTEAVMRRDRQAYLWLRTPVIGNRSDATRLRFSLANVAAISGAAPQESLMRFYLTNLGFPEHYEPTNVRSPPRPALTAFGRPHEKEWPFGDGGHEDNLGLAPLLQRRVDNILVFANSVTPLGKSAFEACGKGLREGAAPGSEALQACIFEMIGNDIPGFFVPVPPRGLTGGGNIHNVSLAMEDRAGRAAEPAALRPYGDLHRIAADFIANEGLSCHRYIDIRFEGRAAYRPVICFLWLDKNAEWFGEMRAAATRAELDPEAQAALRRALDLDEGWRPKEGSVPFSSSKGFPHIATFNDKPLRIIKVTRPRILALANFTNWMLRRHRKEIAQAFAQNGLRLP